MVQDEAWNVGSGTGDLLKRNIEGGQIPFPLVVEQPQFHGKSQNQARSTREQRIPSSGYQRGRQRGKSLSEKTQEAVIHIAPPVSVTTVVLCMLWYAASAVSNNIAKSILTVFNYPVTLTMVQFVYAVVFSWITAAGAKHFPLLRNSMPRGTLSASGLAPLGTYVLRCTAPMACFQICGHLLSYSAMSSIPVSLVHAIKSLSPLFTVAVFTFLFGVHYNIATYASMLPLTLGVIMTCAAEFRVRPLAILNALVATLIFVTQNIYSKQLLTHGTLEHGGLSGLDRSHIILDKMSILCYCAGLAFVGTLPIWLYVDGARLFSQGGDRSDYSVLRLLLLFTVNGLSHFFQNLLSFMVLSATTPVAYSIASLLKRIVVISVAILWFRQQVSSQQGWGIFITFSGLYIYDRFGGSSKSSRKNAVLPV